MSNPEDGLPPISNEFMDSSRSRYFEQKNQFTETNYADRMIRKFLRLMGVNNVGITCLPGGRDKVDASWFDHHFPSCPFRLAFLKTWKPLALQDFFWRPTKNLIMDAYEEARDNYAGECPNYDPVFHRLALVYYDVENKKDIVFREHHDAVGALPKGYPRCLRMVRDTLYVMEPLEGFCDCLQECWTPSILD